MRIEAAIFAAFCVIVFFREGAAAQQAELPGVWNTNLSVASGTGAQAWVQFSEDGSYNRLVFLPKPAEDGPGACQISTGRWNAVPSGNSLIVTYTIEDYQPKQCLKTPGTPFVGCEPPPGDYQEDDASSHGVCGARRADPILPRREFFRLHPNRRAARNSPRMLRRPVITTKASPAAPSRDRKSGNGVG